MLPHNKKRDINRTSKQIWLKLKKGPSIKSKKKVLKSDEGNENDQTYYRPVLGSNLVSHPGGKAPNSDIFCKRILFFLINVFSFNAVPFIFNQKINTFSSSS